MARHVLPCCAALLLFCAVPPVRAQDATASVYVVKKGDTLYGIARAQGVSVARLRRLNAGLKKGSTIYPGQKLRVRSPRSASPAPQPDASASSEAPAPLTDTPLTDTPFYGAHTAGAGATFYTIAARYGTSVDSLEALNDATGTFLEPGDVVRLPTSLGPPAHTVQAGETIYDVTRRYGVSAKMLQRLNGLEHKQVHAGQHLRIPGREAPQPQPKGARRPVRATGPVACYPASYEDRLMAGGTRYDPKRYVASHPTLPIGTVVLLTNPANGHQTFAQVADRGPLDEQFVMDVSAAVYDRLGLPEESKQPVEVRVMD